MEKIGNINDDMKAIEKDLRDLNKISNKNEVKKGIEIIKEKLNKVKRSISQHNNKRFISKSMLVSDEKNENGYYQKKKLNKLNIQI